MGSGGGTMERSVIAPLRSQLDRRELLRIGAWTAPALVVAAAVPAAAASLQTSRLVASSFTNTVQDVGGYIFHEPLSGPVSPTGTLTMVVSVPPGYTFTRTDADSRWQGPASVSGGSSGSFIHVPAAGQYVAYGGTTAIRGVYTGSGDFVGQGSIVFTAAAASVQSTTVLTGGSTAQHPSAPATP